MALGSKFAAAISSAVVSLLLFSILAPLAAYGAADSGDFTDTGNSYAQAEIAALARDGVVSGYGDGSFKPKAQISRAELAKLIAIAIGLPENGAAAAGFRDVPANGWSRGYVGALVDAGIAKGVAADAFAPDAKVTREELAVMFIRAMGLEETAKALNLSAALSDFATVSDWAKADVALAGRIGFVQGMEGADGSFVFDPRGSAERQAVSLLTFKLMKDGDTYVDEANKLADGDSADEPDSEEAAEPAVTALKAIDSTTVEASFDAPLKPEQIRAEDFKFDNGLTVAQAGLKDGSSDIVVLGTSAMSSGTTYKLSYKGKDTGLSVTAPAPVFAGGGFVPPPPSGPPSEDVAEQLSSGEPQGTVVVTASGVYGAENGPDTPVEHLTIDPGPTGEVTLRHIVPDELEVLSGDVNSIKLLHTVIKQLRVNAINNGGKDVRIEAEDGTSVEQTTVLSQAVLESSSSTGSLGKIKLSAEAAGKTITLKGNIDSEVTVDAPGVTITLAPPSKANPMPTLIKSLIVSAGAKINAAPGTKLSAINVTGPNATLQLGGQGSIEKIVVDDSASGTVLDIGDDAGIHSIQADSDVTLKGSPDAISAIHTTGSTPVRLDASIKDAVKAKAIDNAVKAIEAIGAFESYTTEFLGKLNAAGLAVAKAEAYGASASDITNLDELEAAQTAVDTVKADVDDEKTSLQPGFAEGDSAGAVTQNLLLKQTGTHGETIVWTSGKPDVIDAATGTVTRPASDRSAAEVMLTAVISLKGFSLSAAFAVTVKAEEKASEAPIKKLTWLASNAVEVSFSSPVTDPDPDDFTFDQGLLATRAFLKPGFSDTVIVLTGKQAGGTTYMLSYRSDSTGKSFTAPDLGSNHAPSAYLDFSGVGRTVEDGPFEHPLWPSVTDEDRDTLTVISVAYDSAMVNVENITDPLKITPLVKITPLAMGRSYVVATLSDGKGGTLAIVTQVDIAPVPPELLSAEPGVGQATLKWTPVSGATSYRIGISQVIESTGDPEFPPLSSTLMLPVEVDLSSNPIVYTVTYPLKPGAAYVLSVFSLHGEAIGRESNRISVVIPN